MIGVILKRFERKIKEPTQRFRLTGSRKTLDAGFDDYMTLAAPKRLSPSSLRTDKSYYKNHIQPVFGFRETIRIESIEVQKFLVQKKS